MKKTKNRDPIKHCANYNCGKCLGVIIGRGLSQWIDLDLSEKDCILETWQPCYYFDDTVKKDT